MFPAQRLDCGWCWYFAVTEALEGVLNVGEADSAAQCRFRCQPAAWSTELIENGRASIAGPTVAFVVASSCLNPFDVSFEGLILLRSR